MYSSSLKLLYPLSIFIFFFVTPSSLSNPIFLADNNITLFGEASLNSSSIILTRENSCTPPPPTAISGVGRAFYVSPVRFLDPSSNATASFSCGFSFTITTAGYCPFAAEGFAFLITSNTSPSSLDGGYMGLPPQIQAGPDQDSYFAVEFDTNFDPNRADINGNHVGIDVNSVQSLASVDLFSREIDLKNGKELTAWIEYRDSENTIKVWVWYSEQNRSLEPVLVTRIGLSDQFKEFMYIGFTASNGKGGSSAHVVDRWRFNTSFEPLPSTVPMDTIEQGGCLSPRNPDVEIGSGLNRRVLNLSLLLGVFAVVIILTPAVVVACLRVIKRRRRVESERQMRRFSGGMMVPQMLSLSEIRTGTNGFDHDKIIGEGASAVVYEGAIPSCGPVAVKRFNHENRFVDSSISRIPFDTEFATMVGCLRHKNLVQLQGWCCERNELVLVYEYMPNGNLDQILHSRTNLTKHLTWERRLNIIQGVASALVYLHEECENQIIHRDVKACNILLDSEFNAKLGDFGLAEVYRHDVSTRSATIPAGTMGYLAPEYVFSGVPTVKSDVYSFGVVVLEVATGRRPVDEEAIVVTDYVWDMWEKGVMSEAGDGNLMGRFKRKEMEGTLMVGLWCAHPDCEKRPTMREAAGMLRGESTLPGLPARRPTLRIQSDVPMELMSFEDDDTPWSTPGTHFSKNR